MSTDLITAAQIARLELREVIAWWVSAFVAGFMGAALIAGGGDGNADALETVFGGLGITLAAALTTGGARAFLFNHRIVSAQEQLRDIRKRDRTDLRHVYLYECAPERALVDALRPHRPPPRPGGNL